MPDQTDTPTDDQPTKRMTTAEAAKTAQVAAQNASAALRVAQGADDMVAAVSEQVTDLGQRVRDREVAHAELRDEVMQRLAGITVDPADVIDAEGKPALTRDQVDSRIHEALAPLHDEVHALRSKGTLTPESASSLTGILARLETAERAVAGTSVTGITGAVVQEIHPILAELRKRVTSLEEDVSSQGNPISVTLAEDHLSDQVQAQVERALTNLSGVSETNTARADQLVRDFADLGQYVDRQLDDVRQHLATHGTRVVAALPDTTAGVRSVLQGGSTSNGLGAPRKVLALMRMVTHLGKERQADMGQGGKFKFRGIDEAMDAVGHAMREVGLILSPEVLKEEGTSNAVTKKGNGDRGPYESTVLWTTTKLTMRYTFVDPEDGSTHTIEMVGEGRDASDKSTSKAGSMAFKYALLQALCIPVNGLDDSDASPPQVMENERSTPPAQQRPQQQATPERTAQQAAGRAAEALTALRNVYRVDGGAQAQYNRVVEIMNRVKREELLEFVLEGSTLSQHGHAVLATLEAPPPAAYQPTQQELDRAVQDLPRADTPPGDDPGGSY